MAIIIPAHDESSVIERCLAPLLTGISAGDFEVIVVCNGCSDNTAEKARSMSPHIRVIELTAAGKPGALNAGDAAATVFPRAYLDADIVIDAEALLKIVDVLSEAKVASPAPNFDLSQSSVTVRWFYEVWQRLPYIQSGLIGNGFFALSKAGRQQFDQFPEIIADDLFVQGLFRREERTTLADCFYVVHPPRTLSGVLAVRTRAYFGKSQLDEAGLAGQMSSAANISGARGVLDLIKRQPRLLPKAVVYVAINATAKARAARRMKTGHIQWDRDDTSRPAS